jgi:hypothetical protein
MVGWWVGGLGVSPPGIYNIRRPHAIPKGRGMVYIDGGFFLLRREKVWYIKTTVFLPAKLDFPPSKAGLSKGKN